MNRLGSRRNKLYNGEESAPAVAAASIGGLRLFLFVEPGKSGVCRISRTVRNLRYAGLLSYCCEEYKTIVF